MSPESHDRDREANGTPSAEGIEEPEGMDIWELG